MREVSGQRLGARGRGAWGVGRRACELRPVSRRERAGVRAECASPRPLAGEGQSHPSPRPLGEGQGVRACASPRPTNLRSVPGEGQFYPSPRPLAGEGQGVRAAAFASLRLCVRPFPALCKLTQSRKAAKKAIARFLIPNPQSRIPSRRFAARRGIGLLEVLIAIFLLMVGLLGLAVLIVVGKLTLMQVERSDRTAACGHAAVHEIKVRNLLNYTIWRDSTGALIPPSDVLPPIALDPEGLWAPTPLTNPLGTIARVNINVWSWHASQYYSLGSLVAPSSPNGHGYRCIVAGTSGATEPTWPPNGGTVVDGGVTWQDAGAQSLLPDSIFRSHDDLIFTLPEQNESTTPPPAGSRPTFLGTQSFSFSGGAGTPPFAVGNTITATAGSGASGVITQVTDSGATGSIAVSVTTTAVFAASDTISNGGKTATIASPPVPVPIDPYVGDTSWFMTLSPAPAEVGLPVSSRTTYNVSVVVCYQRNLLMNGTAPDGEQTYPLASGGGPPAVTMLTVPAYGSGSIVLSGPTNVAPTVKNGQWLMLCSGTQATWYRVANAAPPQTVTIANSINVTVPRVDQYITILGPDWNGGASLSAVTVDGVTGVYTATLPVQQ